MNMRGRLFCGAVIALAAALASCGSGLSGPDVWTGSEVEIFLLGGRSSFTSEEQMSMRGPNHEAPTRNYLHIDDKFRLGLPLLEIGEYSGNRVTLGWMAGGDEYVPRHCDEAEPPITITVDGHEHGVVWGTFEGVACPTSTRQRHPIRGTWAASTKKGEE